MTKKLQALFAHLKRILKLEFLLAATAQHLRRMAKRLFEGQRAAVELPA